MRIAVPMLALAACAGTQTVGAARDAPASDAAPSDANNVNIAPFGATLEPGGAAFRVWAPHASAAWVVVGDAATAAPISLQPGADGTFSAHVPGVAAGARYVYRFELAAGSAAIAAAATTGTATTGTATTGAATTGAATTGAATTSAAIAGAAGSGAQTPGQTIDRLDPYSREIDAGGSASIVVDPSAYAWQTPAFTRPARAQTIVYELHVGGYTAAGTLAAARAGLPGLAALGVNAIELMPIQDSGAGATSWGYAPQLFLAPKPAYGTPDDVRAFVDEAHGLGIAVWLDVVYNHTDGWAQAPLRCFDGDCPGGGAGIYFFTDPAFATTPWGPRPDFTAPEVSDMLLAADDAWLTEMRGDGFRFDSVSNIRALDGSGSVPGGAAFLRAATDRARAAGATSVAEDLKGDAEVTATSTAGGLGFDAQWDGAGYDLDAMLAAGSDDARDLGAVVGALTGGYNGDPFARVIFVEDHDLVGNGGARLPSMIDAATPESLRARRLAMLGAVLILTAPGVPMLFMGQEQLATGTYADPPAPLAPADAAGLAMRAFYTDLLRLRRNLDGGAGGLGEPGVEIIQRNDSAKAIAYRRYGASGQDVLVLVNLRNQAYTSYLIGVDSPGPWQIRLSTDRAAYGSDFPVGPTGALTATPMQKDGKAYALSIPIGAYGAVVLSK